MKGYDKEPKFSPDGSKLAWMSMKTPGFESDVNDIIIMNVKTGIKHICWGDQKVRWYYFSSFSWVDQYIYAGVPEDGSNQVYQITQTSKG